MPNLFEYSPSNKSEKIRQKQLESFFLNDRIVSIISSNNNNNYYISIVIIITMLQRDKVHFSVTTFIKRTSSKRKSGILLTRVHLSVAGLASPVFRSWCVRASRLFGWRTRPVPGLKPSSSSSSTSSSSYAPGARRTAGSTPVCSLQRLHSARFNILTKIPGAKGGRYRAKVSRRAAA